MFPRSFLWADIIHILVSLGFQLYFELLKYALPTTQSCMHLNYYKTCI